MSAEEEPDLAREALDAARAGARRRPTPPGNPRRSGSPGPVDADRPRGGLTGSGPDAGDPAPLVDLVRRLVRDRGWERTTADVSVMARWEALVGADIAAHCQPASLKGGELVVVAESTAWATQLRLLSGRIQAMLTRELGAGVVTAIRVHGPTAPSWRKGPRHVSGRGPRDTYG